MTSVITYCNRNLGNVRTILDSNNKIWFVAKDVAEILGYGQTSDMTKRLKKDELCKVNQSAFSADGSVSRGHSKPYTIINEPGLYRAIFGSKKPEAEEFQNWVYYEVLPSIRKTGMYNGGDETLKRVEELIDKQNERITYLEEHSVLVRKSPKQEILSRDPNAIFIESEAGEFPIISIDGTSYILDKHLSAMYGRTVTVLQRLALYHKHRFPVNSFRRATKEELERIKKHYEPGGKFTKMPMLYTYGACCLLATLLKTKRASEACKAITLALKKKVFGHICTL